MFKYHLTGAVDPSGATNGSIFQSITYFWIAVCFNLCEIVIFKVDNNYTCQLNIIG